MGSVNHGVKNALALAAWVGLATGAGAETKADAALQAQVQARYAQERARCLAGQSQQDQATCLREAGAARDAASKRKLEDGGASYEQNAKERCAALSGDEALDCMARAKGQGKVSGSVEGGGVLRETVTRTVGPSAPAASAASAP